MAGRVKRLPEQAQRVLELGCDLVCLQEVTATTVALWRKAFTSMGWADVAVARPFPSQPGQDSVRSRRPLRVLIASRQPVREVPIAGLPWPERALAVRVEGLELVGAHSPISPSPGLAKVMTHEALHRHLAEGTGPRIICGDLNTPRREHPDGSAWTFARTRYGKLRADRGERWDKAELALIKGLEPFGFRDAFRERYGPKHRELSWEWQRSGGGYRLDHLIVSAEVSVAAVSYVHDWRWDGLSDHSPLVAELRWPDPVEREPTRG